MSTQIIEEEELTVAGGPLVHAGCPFHIGEEAICGELDMGGVTDLPINCPLCVEVLSTTEICAACGGCVFMYEWEIA